MDKIIATSRGMKRMMDDDYTLFASGKILHEYDRSIYPGGQNLRQELTASQIDEEVKQRLLTATAGEDKELARKLLGIDG